MIRYSSALRLPPQVRLAFTGAGGKTTAMFRLARELVAGVEKAERMSVLVTATTHLAVSQLTNADHHFILERPQDVDALAFPPEPAVILVTGSRIEEGERVAGLSAAILERLLAFSELHHFPLLVEADGSRKRPLKAPAEHEPAVPPWVNMTVTVAGLSGIGQRLTAETVHRPEIFAQLAGISLRGAITPKILSQALAHPQGGLKNIPAGVRKIALLNQADTLELQAAGRQIADELITVYDAVMIAKLGPDLEKPAGVYAVHEPVAGVVLAAGGSTRMGRPKQLLEWQGELLVHRSARVALEAGLDPVVVVTGANAAEVETALAGLPVQIVRNMDWQSGQGYSIATGVRSLPARTGAAIFLLVDQPLIQPSLIRALVDHHSQTLYPIIAPLADGRRGNPVLFDRLTFPDLMALEGDVGGRVLFSRFSPEWLPWNDPSILIDIDNKQDYTRLNDAGKERTS